MSINKFYQEQWVTVVYGRAVALFHEARQGEQNRDVPLVDLARQCANTAFQEYADMIVGDKETIARRFMTHCRENFDTEVAVAIEQRAQADINSQQLPEPRAN